MVFFLAYNLSNTRDKKLFFIIIHRKKCTSISKCAYILREIEIKENNVVDWWYDRKRDSLTKNERKRYRKRTKY